MIKWLKKFTCDEAGATMIEYGLLLTLVALAAVVALTAIGESLSGIFSAVGSKIASAKDG